MVRGQVNGAVGSVSSLVTALSAMEAAMGGDKTLNQLDQTAKLVGRMRALGDALSANMADVANTAAWANPMLNALNTSPVCSADPVLREFAGRATSAGRRTIQRDPEQPCRSGS